MNIYISEKSLSYLPILIIFAGIFSVGMSSGTIYWGTLLLCMCVLVLYKCKHYYWTHNFFSINKWIIIVAFYMLIITLLSTVINGDSRNLVGDFFGVFVYVVELFFGVIYFDCLNEDGTYAFFSKFRKIMIAFAIMGIIEYVLKENIFSNLFENDVMLGYQNYRCYSIFTHPTIFANFLMIGLVITFFIENKKCIHYIEILLFLIALIFTGTRSSWIAIVLFGLFYVCKKKKKFEISMNRFWIFILLMTIGLVFILSTDIVNVIYRIALHRLRASNTIRSSFIQYMLNLYIKSNPVQWIFGHGRNAAGVAISRYSAWRGYQQFTSVDNQYLTFLYDYGAIFLMGLVIGIIKIFIRFVKTKDVFMELIILLILVECIEIVFFEITNWYNLRFFFFMLLGIYMWRKNVLMGKY